MDLLFVNGQGLQHIDAETRQIGRKAGDFKQGVEDRPSVRVANVPICA